jgi:hypothetical protein
MKACLQAGPAGRAPAPPERRFLVNGRGTSMSSDPKTKGHTACKSDAHTKHLCYFVSYGYHVDNAEDYKDLVEDPAFVCQICGRTAHARESLCQPVKL